MNVKIEKINKIIFRIKELFGLNFEYDEDFLDEEIILFANDELGITLNDDLTEISIFISCSYYDFNPSDIKEGCYFQEDLDANQYTLLREKSFYLFLMGRSTNYSVSIWDDGNYMCPGYVNRIGYFNVPISEEVFKDFVSIYNDYLKQFDGMSTVQIQKYILINFFSQNEQKLIEKNGIFEFCDGKISFEDVQVLPEGNISKYYLGKEKFIFEINNRQYYTNAKPIETFIEFISFCEILGEVSYLVLEEELQIRSLHFVLCIKAYKDDKHMASQIEEMPLLINLMSFSNFAGQLKKGVYENIAFLMQTNIVGAFPIVVTEGYTDWLHLKKWWALIKADYKDIDVAFWEYYPTNFKGEKVVKQDMGDAVLVEMCKAYSKMSLGRTFIFIADRDNIKITKELSGTTKNYKSWGNGVYSFIIPIPNHRNLKDEICIEHYYSDDEIKTKIQCVDNVERRLYIGNEFDQFGRGIFEEYICTKRNLCGKDSIKIIDGASDSKVLKIKANDNTNYALSKSRFVDAISPQKGATYNSFKKIFDIINEILIDIKNSN